MSATLDQIPRPEKIAIAKALHVRLSERFKRSGAEVALDDYLPQLLDIARRLETTPGNVSEEDRAKRIAAVVSADDEVDTYLRHIEGFLENESLRKTGTKGALARALHDAAFPDGLAHIDDRIVEENFHCRASIAILRDPRSAATLAALEMPAGWLDRWETALDASDAAISEVLRTVAVQTASPSATADARDPEDDWVDLMVRLRRYVSNRAEHDDLLRKEEGRDLLRPLFDALQRLRLSTDTTTAKKG